MNLAEMKRKYAYTLAKVGLNVQKGQPVLVEATIKGAEFTPIFAEECYKLGASNVIIHYLDEPNLKMNVQKGQPVLVEATIKGAEFTPIFAEECYKLGASNVIIHYLDEPNLKIAAKYRSDADIRKVEDWEELQCQKYLDEGACYVRLEGVDPKLMEDVPEAQANAIFAHIDAVRNIMRKASREKHCQWLIAMVPTQNWAEYILKDVPKEQALEELWKLLFKLCYIEEDNDIEQTWAKRTAEKDEIGIKLDSYHFTKLHYTASNGTDLTVTLTPYSKFGPGERPADRIPFHANIPTEELCTSPEKFGTASNGTDLTVTLTPYSKFGPGERPADRIPFHANIPTEELCTSPEKFGTEGVVYASKPLVLGGKSIENFGFRFEKGKVVEVIANEGKEMLEALVATTGAGRQEHRELRLPL